MKPKTRLLFRLQCIKDETTRKMICKTFLEYHMEDGTILDARRAVGLCCDRNCIGGKEKCSLHLEFMKYHFCM